MICAPSTVQTHRSSKNSLRNCNQPHSASKNACHIGKPSDHTHLHGLPRLDIWGTPGTHSKATPPNGRQRAPLPSASHSLLSAWSRAWLRPLCGDLTSPVPSPGHAAEVCIDNLHLDNECSKLPHPRASFPHSAAGRDGRWHGHRSGHCYASYV